MQENASVRLSEAAPTNWETAFRESERRFRLLVDSATNVALFLLDPNGRITSWNEGARRILGYAEAEVIGKHASLIFTPEDCVNGIPEQELATALREGRAADLRWYQRKDGSRFWADSVMERLVDEAGQLVGFARVLHDATEQKSAQDALIASEERFRGTQTRLETALSSGNIATWTLDMDTKQLVTDAYFSQLFAVPVELTAGADLGEFLPAIHPDDVPRVMAALAEAEAGPRDYRAEYRLVRADGSVRYVLAQGSGERDAQGRASTLTGVIVDITERVERERRERFLNELAARARGLLDPDEVLYETAKAVGQYTGSHRCAYLEVNNDADTFTIRRDFVDSDAGIDSMAGTFPLSAFGPPLVARLREGRLIQSFDVEEDPLLTDENRAAYRATNLRSFLAVPLRKAGHLVAILALQYARPRAWTEDEAEILEAVMERTWLAVENARLYRTLQIEERRQRFLSELTERTRRLSDPDAVLDETLRSVGEFLGLSRYLYADVDEANESIIVHRNWVAPQQDVASIKGAWTFDTWIRDVAPIGVTRAELRGGLIGVIRDFETDARTAQEFQDAPEQPDEYMVTSRMHAAVRVPLHRNGRWVAMLSAQSIAPRDWSPDEVAMLETIAERTWLTLENLRLFREAKAQEQEQRVRAERASVLNKISKAVRGAIEPKAVLESAVTLLGQGLRADRCYFVRVDAARDTARVSPEWLREDAALLSLANQTFRVSTYGVNRDAEYRAGRTHLVNDVATDAPEDAAALQALQIRSLIRVPIDVGSYGTGLTVAMADAPRVWTDGEVRLVENVAALVRAALEAVHIQQRERNIAQQLQDALIPPPPTDLPGLALASFYRPALGEAQVGGDFFDVFPVEEGCTALVVADLSGKGLAAASQVSTVRNMLRYALYSAPTLAEAVTGLHRTLVKHDLLTGFATLFLGLYDEKERSLSYVNCGQEPGLIWRAATGNVEQMLPTGPVLGGFGDGDHEEQCIALAVGDVLALFTDGLTEVGPSRKIQLEVDGVSKVLRDCCGAESSGSNTPQAIVDCLIAGIDDFARAGTRDDIALLVGVVGAPTAIES